MKRVLGIGETVLDILFKNDQPMKAVPGGSTFNSIVSLGRAGVDCALSNIYFVLGLVEVVVAVFCLRKQEKTL